MPFIFAVVPGINDFHDCLPGFEVQSLLVFADNGQLSFEHDTRIDYRKYSTM